MKKQIDKNAVAALLSNFQRVETSSNVFGEGKHLANVTSMHISNSFQQHDGQDKTFENEPEWKTPTLQVIVWFAKDNNAILHKYNMGGFKKYDKLTDEEKEDEKYSCSEVSGYALLNGDRIPDQKATADCHRIFSELFNAIGLPAGSDIDDLEEAIESRPEVMITVKEVETNKGNKTWEVTKVRKPVAKADIADEAFGE
jgi:hypothetical protein